MRSKPCTFLVPCDNSNPIAAAGIKANLKHGDAAAKARALKQALALIVSGDTSDFRDLPAIILRNVLPCADEDLQVQKLVLLYLETVYKGDDVFARVLSPPDTGLVRDYLRRNLRHRDAYVRGLTLRFISRLAHPDLLEPIVEFILVNLYHRHGFVRRHVYSAMFAIYRQPKMPDGRQLLTDALDIVEHHLIFERDAAVMRNAFLMLCTCTRERAVAYLLANADRVVAEWPGAVQVVAIALVRRACCGWDNKDGQGKSLIGIVVSLSARIDSSAVVYEAADALLFLCSDDPVALCAVANAYLKLLFSPPLIDDTDVKRIVLERLQELGSKLSTVISSRQLAASSSPNPNMMIEESNQ